MSKDDSTLIRVIWFVLAMFLIVEMPHVMSSPFRGTTSYDAMAALFSLLTFPLMYIAVIWSLKAEGGVSISDLGFNLEDRNLFVDLIIGLVSGIAAAGLVFTLALLFGGQLRDPTTLNLDLVVSVALIAIPVAVLEEISYRGYMVTRMEKVWGRQKAIILGSLVFSLVHFNWYSPLGTVPLHLILMFSLNLFLGGVVLAYSYYMSGRRLWIPIGFHFSWNVLAYSLFPIFPNNPVLLPEIFQIEWGLTSIVGFLFGLSIIWQLLSMRKESK